MSSSFAASVVVDGLSAWSAGGPLGGLCWWFLGFAWLVYFFETWLDSRQHSCFAIPTKPAKITYITQQEFDKAQAYGHDKSSFHFVTSLWGNVKLTAMIVLGYYPAVWAMAAQVLETTTGLDATENVLARTAVFYVLDASIETVLSIPVQVYSLFVIEEKHGFNKQTASLFVTDTIKGLLLNALIAPPLISLIISVVEWGGEYFYIYVAALFFVIQILAVPIYSNFIQPCFNKVEPLPEGTLRTGIEALAGSIQFPLTGLFVIDGSKRSSHSNAYFYGFWRFKKIVLFDTLTSQCSESQVIAVLAHELGHWSLSHTVKNLILGQAQTLGMFFLFGVSLAYPALYSDFGFSGDARPTYIGLLLFSFIFSPVQHVLAFVMHIVSRRFEFEADRFAVDLGHGEQLALALVTLQTENKSTPISDPLYSAYHHSHPPLLQRLNAIEAAQKEVQKKAK